jgi:glycosyltransferase involved in cell wall biosynthesis
LIFLAPQARHVREEELGLTPARLRGIKESRGSLLVFVDDDNVLAPDFLEQSSGVVERYPHLSVFGAGILEPEFEEQPSSELLPLLPALALRRVTAVRWSNNPKDYSCLPCGAGLCVTRAAAEYYIQLVARTNFSTFLDRRGGQLTSHGDDLFSWGATHLGKGFGIFPELRITHLISAGRLERSYLLRLIDGSSFSHWLLNYSLGGAKPKPASFFRHIHLVLHGIRNGRFAMQCQQARARGQARAAQFIAEKQLRPVEFKGAAASRHLGLAVLPL